MENELAFHYSIAIYYNREFRTKVIVYVLENQVSGQAIVEASFCAEGMDSYCSGKL